MHLNTRRTFISIAIVSTYGWLGFPAIAQNLNASATELVKSNETKITATVDKDQIQEIQVTATRHSTSLLKTPVAMTAVPQEELTRQGIVDVRGLSGQIPSLQLGTAHDGSGGVQIAMRGVTSSDFTEIGNPAVGLHVDGLYSPRPQSALALLFDLDQLEVLRGPQGTLFGRNSTGGSINIRTAKLLNLKIPASLSALADEVIE